MGIPSYFSYIIQNYDNIYVHLKNIVRDNLYMDCNSIIYDCLRKTELVSTQEFNDEKFETSLINEICDKIKEYINIIKPKHIVYIAFDGVAPIAKLQQQRTRRYKSNIFQLLEKQCIEEHLKSTKNNGYKNDLDQSKINKKQIWNQTAITPGTEFMKRLDIMVNKYFTKKENKLRNVQYIISGSNKPGEGEHKLFQFIRTNDTFHKDTNTMIYGLDADLIMLSLNHLDLTKNIFLFREIPDYDNDLQDIYGKNGLCVINMKSLGLCIQNEMMKTHTINRSHQTISKLYDYIFISFLLGNDFLPHHMSLNIRTHGIKTLLDCYSNVIQPNEQICNGKKINWKLFHKLLKELAETEEKNSQYEYSILKRQGKKHINITDLESIQYKINILPQYNRSIEEYINPFQTGWKDRYYESLFHINNDPVKIKEISLHFIEGLEWTMKYYTNGCKNYSWFYKYDYPPLFCDLNKYIPLFDSEFIKEDYTIIHPYTQLAYVLPESALQLLPFKIRTYLLTKYQNNYQIHKIIWAFCKYLWESHVEFPFIDIFELEKEIQTLIKQ